jgi:hypothetical protein
MAAGSTYEPIATQTLGSAAASVTFSSIPQGYTDLVYVNNAIGATDGDVYGQLNGDTGSNYSYTTLYGYGSGLASGRASNTNQLGGVGRIATGGSVSILNFQNYSNSTTYKSVLTRVNNSGFTMAWVNLWRSTAAITSITIYPYSGTFSSGSTFTLYGIAEGIMANTYTLI